MASQPKIKVRKYSVDYLKCGFIAALHDERLPFCLLCHQTLVNDSMRPVKLQNHFTTRHAEHVNKPLNYFSELKEKHIRSTRTIPSLFNSRNVTAERALKASYEISLLVAKSGKPHTVAEELIKPSLLVFANTVLEKGASEATMIPLSNDSVRQRLDEMSGDVEEQLVSKLRSRKFTVQVDESTINRSDSILMAFVRYIDEGVFKEEMLLCEYFPTTTTALDIYNIFSGYLAKWDISMTSITSCAADGAPAMIGKHNGFLKLLKDNNPYLQCIHCVLHRENLVSKNLSEELSEILQCVIKCINKIKANPKMDRLFKEFCQNNDVKTTLLLHSHIRWLSQGNSLSRFWQLYEQIKSFLEGNENFDMLWTSNGRASIAYLSDIFGKLNQLNLSLQGQHKTLLDARTSILGFITRLSVIRSELSRADYSSMSTLQRCEVSDEILLVFVNHLDMLIADFNRRFDDLRNMTFPDWLVQPMLCSIEEVEPPLRNEVSELQQDLSVGCLFRCKGQMAWLALETTEKYPTLSAKAQLLLLPFPTSYLVESGFSAVTDIVTKKRNRLNICDRGDLRLKLTELKPRIEKLCSKHQPQGSH